MFSVQFLHTAREAIPWAIGFGSRNFRCVTNNSLYQRATASLLHPPRFAGRQPSSERQHANDEPDDGELHMLNNPAMIPNLKVDKILSQHKPSHRRSPTEHTQRGAEVDKKQRNSAPTYSLDIEKETYQTLRHLAERKESTQIVNKKLNLQYTELHPHDSRYGNLMLLISSRKRRELKGKIVLEGKRLITEGIKARLPLDSLVFSDLDAMKELKLPKRSADSIFRVPRHTIKQWSSLTTSPGIIGIFDQASDLNQRIDDGRKQPALPLTVVCDNIREPNNLGSLIRSCAAVSAEAVVLLKGCAHPWDPKCLRGGCGAHFRTPIYGPIEPAELVSRVPAGATFLFADNNKPIRVSQPQGAATGNPPVPSVRLQRYDAIQYARQDHLVLVVGGETHGVSDDVKNLVVNLRNGTANQREHYLVHIPLANGVESLNAAAALTVILYEIRRQLFAAAQ